MDDVKIKYKFYLLYFACVLIPLVITDTLIMYNTYVHERSIQEMEMQGVSQAVINMLSSEIDAATMYSINIYKNSYINDYITNEYPTPLDYIKKYQEFKERTLLPAAATFKGLSYTIYADNPTIINGGFFHRFVHAQNSSWFRQYRATKEIILLYFDFADARAAGQPQRRKIYLLRDMDYFRYDERQKILKVEIDYASLYQKMLDMNFQFPVYVLSNGNEILSNTPQSHVMQPFHHIDFTGRKCHIKDFSLAGRELNVCVQDSSLSFTQVLKNHAWMFFVLIMLNIILPLLFMTFLNSSFTKRIQMLTSVMQKSSSEKLRKIHCPQGKDEIGILMSRYNEMADKIELLIRTVYKDKIKEQEMIVARQNAELLALRGQINPHFLFNILESIRMHSVIRHESETAQMIQRLALIQRKYVDWGMDNVTIAQEMECVKAYLELQKYRFGERLNYSLEVDEQSREHYIPKLSIVTFVENSCVHGIENKSSRCWIFVRALQQDGFLEIEIEDTGIGMDEEEKSVLRNHIDSASMELLQQRGHVGIINACLRLKIATENTVQFHIESEKMEGSVFTIRIPLRKEETDA